MFSRNSAAHRSDYKAVASDRRTLSAVASTVAGRAPGAGAGAAGQGFALAFMASGPPWMVAGSNAMRAEMVPGGAGRHATAGPPSE